MRLACAVQTPAFAERFRRLPLPVLAERNKERHVVTDPATADNDHACAGPHRSVEDFRITDDPWIIAPGDVEQARADARRDHHVIEIPA